MSSAPRKISFFAAFAGCCRGTAIFPALLKQGIGRTLLHFFLMAFLAALFITVARSAQMRPEFDALEKSFAAVFGEVEIRGNVIRPVGVDRVQPLRLPGNGLLIYVPTGADPQLAAQEELEKAAYFVCWTPGMIFWGQYLADRSCLLLQARFNGSGLGYRTISLADVDRAVAAETAIVPEAAGEPEILAPAELFSLIRKQMGGALFCNYFIVVFAGTLFYLLIFVAMFTLAGLRQGRSLKFRDYFIIALYAALPVLPAAALFPAFDLPLFSFSSAAVVSTIIYFMIVVGGIERDRIRQHLGGEQ